MDSNGRFDMSSINLSTYAKNLGLSAKLRYVEKLNGFNIHNYKFPDPYIIAKDKWRDNVAEWPPVEFGDIYIYLKSCDHEDFDEKSLKNYKSLSAYEYVVSGKVQRIYHYKESHFSFLLLSGEVQRSQKLSEPNHRPWVIVEDNGCVTTAHCTCMSGLGEACSHIAALLFKVEKARNLFKNRPSATEEMCKWNSSCTSGKVECTTLENLNMEKYNNRSQSTAVTSKRKPKKRKMVPVLKLPAFSREEIDSLNRACPDAVCMQLLDSSTDSADSTDSDEENNDIPPTIIEAVKMASRKGCIKETIWKKFNTNNCAALMKMTVKQSLCPLWFKHRRGRFTSSHFKAILKRKKWDEAFAQNLLLQKKISTPATEWGKINEDKALKTYADLMLCQHSNFNSENCGLWINHMPHLGASPDAIVRCDCCGDGIIEIKCPYKHRDKRIEECLKDKMFCLDENKCLKEDHAYFYQIQGQLAISKKNYCDFVVWTCVDIHVQRILLQPDFWKECEDALENIFYKYMVPVLQKAHV